MKEPQEVIEARRVLRRAARLLGRAKALSKQTAALNVDASDPKQAAAYSAKGSVVFVDEKVLDTVYSHACNHYDRVYTKYLREKLMGGAE